MQELSKVLGLYELPKLIFKNIKACLMELLLDQHQSLSQISQEGMRKEKKIRVGRLMVRH